MTPYKVGIWVDEHSYPQLGGSGSYTQKLINGIDLKQFDAKLEIVFVGFNLKPKFTKQCISIPYKENWFEKKKNNVLHKLLGISLDRKDIPNIFQNAIGILKENNIEVLFYLSPQVQIKNFPYIITNWDLAHKSTYAFPEFSMNGQYEYREKYFAKILNEAILICCESPQGKQEIEKAYGISASRIKILPMFPGSIVDEEVETLAPNWIKEEVSFFIYPAQFWPHKNHYNLILAFKDFISDSTNANFKLVLTGSDKCNMPYITALIKSLTLENHIIIAGFVQNPILKWLYKNAKGLIFPSFLGPTNMPLLEAYHLGCPIACSNLKGHQDLLTNNALYFEPTDIKAISNAMTLLLDKTAENEPLYSPIIPIDEQAILESIFMDSIAIRRTWGQFDLIH